MSSFHAISQARPHSLASHDKPVDETDNDWQYDVHPMPSTSTSFIDDVAHTRVMMILKTQRHEIEEVIETIQDNITQWRSDLEVCIPELKRILYDLMEDHFDFIKHLASMLGGEHPVIRIINKDSEHLIDAANEVMYQANVILREAECNSEVYMDDHQETIEVVSGSSWFTEQTADSIETDQSPDNHVAKTVHSRGGAATIHGMIPTTVRSQARLAGVPYSNNSAQQAEIIGTNSAQHDASRIDAQQQACLTDVSQAQASRKGNMLSNMSTTTESNGASCQPAMIQSENKEQPDRDSCIRTQARLAGNHNTTNSVQHAEVISTNSAQHAEDNPAEHCLAATSNTPVSASDDPASRIDAYLQACLTIIEGEQSVDMTDVSQLPASTIGNMMSDMSTTTQSNVASCQPAMVQAQPGRAQQDESCLAAKLQINNDVTATTEDNPATSDQQEEALEQQVEDISMSASASTKSLQVNIMKYRANDTANYSPLGKADQSAAHFVATEATDKPEANFVAREATDQSEENFVATETTDQSETNIVAKEATDQSEAIIMATESTDKSEENSVATEATDQSADPRETSAATFRPAGDCVAAAAAETLPISSPDAGDISNLNNKHNLGSDNMQRLKSRKSSGYDHLGLFYPPATSSTNNYSLEPVTLLFTSLLVYAASMTLRKCCNAKGRMKELTRCMRNTFLPSWWSRAATEQLSAISTRALSNTETLGTNTEKGNHDRKPKARQRRKFLTCSLSIFSAMVLGHSLELNNDWTMDQNVRINLSSVDPTRKSNMGTFMFDNVINDLLKMFMDADTDNDGLNSLSKLIDMAGPLPRMNRNAPVDSELARQHMFDSMDIKSTVVVTVDEWYKFSMEHILAKIATLERHPIRDHDNFKQFRTFLKAALAENEFYWFQLELLTENNNDKDGIVTLGDYLPACVPISCQDKLRTFEQNFCLHTVRIFHCKQIVVHIEQEQIDEKCYLHIVQQSSIVQNMDTEVQIASSTHVGRYDTLQVSSNLHVTHPEPVKGDQPLQPGYESWSRETSVKIKLQSAGRVNFSPYLMHNEMHSSVHTTPSMESLLRVIQRHQVLQRTASPCTRVRLHNRRQEVMISSKQVLLLQLLSRSSSQTVGGTPPSLTHPVSPVRQRDYQAKPEEKKRLLDASRRSVLPWCVHVCQEHQQEDEEHHQNDEVGRNCGLHNYCAGRQPISLVLTQTSEITASLPVQSFGEELSSSMDSTHSKDIMSIRPIRSKGIPDNRNKGYRSKERVTSLNISEQLLHVVVSTRVFNAVFIVDAPTVHNGKLGQHDDNEDQIQVSAQGEQQAYPQHWQSAAADDDTVSRLCNCGGQRAQVLFITARDKRHEDKVQTIKLERTGPIQDAMTEDRNNNCIGSIVTHPQQLCICQDLHDQPDRVELGNDHQRHPEMDVLGQLRVRLSAESIANQQPVVVKAMVKAGVQEDVPLQLGEGNNLLFNVFAQAWSPPEASQQGLFLQVQLSIDCGPIDTAYLYTGSDSHLHSMVSGKRHNGGFKLDLLNKPVSRRDVQAAYHECDQDQEFTKDESASNVQCTRTVDGIQEDNNTEEVLIDAPPVMNISGHCHQVPLPKSDATSPNHDEVHNLLAEKQVNENMQSKSKNCGLFILSHKIEHLTSRYNKQSQRDCFEESNLQLPGAGGQEEGEEQHRPHAFGHLPPVMRRLQRKNLNNKRSQKDYFKESQDLQLPGAGGKEGGEEQLHLHASWHLPPVIIRFQRKDQHKHCKANINGYKVVSIIWARADRDSMKTVGGCNGQDEMIKELTHMRDVASSHYQGASSTWEIKSYTLETTDTAGLGSTSEHESATNLGSAQHLGGHHGDDEALCHQDQDGKMATKQAGVCGSCNPGPSTTRTTGRYVPESGQVLNMKDDENEVNKLLTRMPDDLATNLGSAQHLGCHHGDDEALCHQEQDGKMATKQAGVCCSCNSGPSTTRTTGRLVPESGHVLNMKDDENEVNKRLTWMPEDLEEEHGSSNLNGETFDAELQELVTVPYGWKTKPVGNGGTLKMESSSRGHELKSRRLDLVQTGYSQAAVKEMRKFLYYEGWMDDQSLPYLWKMKKNGQNLLFVPRERDLLVSSRSAIDFITPHPYSNEDVLRIDYITNMVQKSRVQDRRGRPARVPSDISVKKFDTCTSSVEECVPKGWKVKTDGQRPSYMALNGIAYKQKDKSEKSIQREKYSRLLAEKTSELARKQLACDQQKKFIEISDKFVKQAAVLSEEKNDLAKAVCGLDNKVLDDKVSKARDAATEGLQDFVNEETGRKILEDSEEIVKQSFLKALNSNEDFDGYDDVKRIFCMVRDVVRSPENINQELVKSPVKFDVQTVKTEMRVYLKNRNESFESIIEGFVQEGLRKNDRIVNIESDEEAQSDIVKGDRTVLLDDDDVTIDELKDVHEIEINKLLTWTQDDLEEEDVTRSVTEESLEVPVTNNAQTKDTEDFTIQRMSCKLPTDRSEMMDGTNDEPDEEIDKVHVKSMLNRIVGTDSRNYLDEAGTPWIPVRPEADVEAAGSPEKHHKETKKIKRLTSLIEEEVRDLPGSHFLGYHSRKTTSSKLYSWGELGTGSAASTTVRNDSGHVQEIKPITTLHIPRVSTRPGVELREHRRQGCLPQLRRQGDTQAIIGTRTSSSQATGQEQSLLHEGLSWSEGPAWPFIAKSSVKVTSSPDTGRLASMTVTSSPNTGMWASVKVTSSTDTGIWACMLITFTMTVNMYTTDNMNHYCTIGHMLATTNTDNLVHYIRIVLKSSGSQESEAFCSVALSLTTKSYPRKSMPKTGRIIGVQGSHPPQLQDPLPQQQLHRRHRYQEVPSQPLQDQGRRQGKFSIGSETVLGHKFIFLRMCCISLRRWSPRAPCPTRIRPRRVQPTRHTTSTSCTSSLLTDGTVYRNFNNNNELSFEVTHILHFIKSENGKVLWNPRQCCCSSPYRNLLDTIPTTTLMWTIHLLVEGMLLNFCML